MCGKMREFQIPLPMMPKDNSQNISEAIRGRSGLRPHLILSYDTRGKLFEWVLTQYLCMTEDSLARKDITLGGGILMGLCSRQLIRARKRALACLLSLAFPGEVSVEWSTPKVFQPSQSTFVSTLPKTTMAIGISSEKVLG